MRRLTTIVSLLLAGCGSSPLVRPIAAAPNLPAGWPSSTDCDGALWAGEARLAGDSSVDMSLALQSDGRPTRRPGADCGPAAIGLSGAPATTSTDMLLGIVVGLWAQRDLDGLLALQDYADSHHMVMGSPADSVTDLSYVLMKPGTRTLLSQAVLSLGGRATGDWQYLPEVYGLGQADFSTHLTLLSAYFQQQLGTLSPLNRAELEPTCLRDIGDALVQAVCGNGALAYELIESPAYKYPSYVRGAPAYKQVHRMLVLHIIGRTDALPALPPTQILGGD